MGCEKSPSVCDAGDDTVAKLRSGELEKLLKEAGVKTKAVAA